MPTTPTDIHLEKIQSAITNRQIVRMDYFSPGSGLFTERVIEPQGTVYYGHAWHIIAYCRLRREYRDFRLDRMSKLSLISEAPPQRDDRAFEQYLEQQSYSTDATLAKIRVLPSAPSSLQQHRYSFGCVREEVRKEYREMWFMVTQKVIFCQWLRTFGESVSLTSPPGFC